MPCFIRKISFSKEITPDKDSPLESIWSSLRLSLFSVEHWQKLRCTFHNAPFSCSMTRKKDGCNIRGNVYLQFKSCDLLSLRGFICLFFWSILCCNVPRFVEMKTHSFADIRHWARDWFTCSFLRSLYCWEWRIFAPKPYDAKRLNMVSPLLGEVVLRSPIWKPFRFLDTLQNPLSVHLLVLVIQQNHLFKPVFSSFATAPVYNENVEFVRHLQQEWNVIEKLF